MEVITPSVITLQSDWEVSLNTQTKDTFWISSSTFGIYTKFICCTTRLIFLKDNQTLRTKTKHGEITFKKQGDKLVSESAAPFSASVVNATAKVLQTFLKNTFNTTIY